MQTSNQTRAVISNTGLQVNNDLNVLGNITKSYAFANWRGNILLTSLPTAGTYFPILTNTYAAGEQLFSADMAVSFVNNFVAITYNGASTKTFQVSAAIIAGLDSQTGNTIEFALYKNGTIYPQSCVKRLMDANTTDPSECTMLTLIELTTGDDLYIFARNLASGVDIFVNCLNFIVTQI